MNIKERIQTMILLEKIKDNPSYAKKIGLEIVINNKKGNNTNGNKNIERTIERK